MIGCHMASSRFNLARRIKTILITVCVVFSAPLQAKSIAKSYYYVVRPNDIFSFVLSRSGYKPLYGESTGYLYDIAKLNKMKPSELDLILEGQRIYLPRISVVSYGLQNGLVRIVKQKDRLFEVEFKYNDQKNKRNISSIGPQVEIQDKEFEQSSDLELSLGTGYSRVDSKFVSNTSNAALLSEPHELVAIAWVFHLDQNFSIGFDVNKNKFKFTDSNRNVIYQEQQYLTSFGSEIYYNFNHKFRTSLRLGMDDILFAPSFQSGTATLETRSLYSYKLGADYQFYAQKKINLILGTHFKSYLADESSNQYSLKAGNELAFQLTVKQNFKHYSVFVKSEYSQKSLKTNINSQVEKNITSAVGISIPLGKDSK